MIRSFVLVATIFILIGCNKKKEVKPSENFETPKDYLSSVDYDKLTIQVVYVKGMSPDQSSLTNLVSFLVQRINKPLGIEIMPTEISSPGLAVLTRTDIINAETAYRNAFSSGRNLAAYILFVDGEYVENTSSSKVLGIAYGPSSMVVFEKTIRDLSGGLGQPSVSTVESTVANHELGHILGLVNNGTDLMSQHQDVAHGKHCNNSSCLMYYAAETNDLISNLLGNNIPVLDANCINDLRSNGGK